MIKLIVPYPPSINTYYGVYNHRIYIKAPGKAYRRRVASHFRGTVVPMHGDVGVFMDVWHPDKRKRDLDNVQKCFFDALQAAGLYEDDSQISEIHVVRRGIKKPGFIEVELW